MTAKPTQAQVFADNLHALMVEKGLSQSDVARAIWGETTDSRGYSVAKNRDRISQYLKGDTLPDPGNLKSLADVLGVGVSELSPKAGERPNSQPAISMSAIAGTPGKVYLSVNTIVPMPVAVKILSLLDGKTVA